MLGFLLFILTIAGVPHYLALFAIIIYAIRGRYRQISEGLKLNKRFTGFLALFVLLITINAIIHFAETGSFQVPNMCLMPFAFICALGLNEKDIKFFIYLVFIECLFGFYEYSLGINTILPGLETDDFSSEELLYFKRVLGLSNNSSSFSEKLLFSIIFLSQFSDLFSKRVKISFFVVFIGGLFVTFNRTAIIASLIYLFFYYYSIILVVLKKRKGLGVALLLIVIIVVGVAIPKYGLDILSQFNRGGDEMDLTGRPYIWASFYDFISNNLFLGNGSAHYMISYYEGRMAHAHNSFIQLFADHGIFIAIFYLLTIFSKFNKRNIIVCISIMVASLTQYVVFWGFSVPDVFLFAFLCNPKFYQHNTKSIFIK